MTEPTEAARLDALHRLNVLDTPPEDRFQRVVRVAQRLFGVPMAAVNLIDDERQWSKALVGPLDPQVPRTTAMCDHTIRQSAPLVVEDASLDERFRGLPAVTGEPHVRFYAGYPLHAPGGERVGALCIIDDRPRTLDEEELVVLRDLASWVEKELAQDEELSPAARLQRELFPRNPPRIEGYEVAGSCLPAHEVGGDFYDWYPVGDEHQLVLGDVMGKGLPAAAIAASVRAALRRTGAGSLADAVTGTAGLLEPELDRAATFVTLFCARLAPSTGELTYVDAGHGLAAVLDAEGGYRALVSDDLPLGAAPDYRWSARRTLLAPDETLVAISDGYLDFFASPDEAVAAALEANGQVSSAAALMRELTSFATARDAPDDVTALVVRRIGA